MASNFFAKNILYLRVKNNLSQSEMYDRCGISTSTWSNYEGKKSEPNISNLLEISNFFNVSLDELVKVDIEIVQPTAGEVGAEPVIKSTSNSTGNSTAKTQFGGTENEGVTPNSNDNLDTWAVMAAIREISWKVDGLRVLIEKKL